MTCQELSDRMPAVARGAASWSAAEAEHLRTCADCRAEWGIVTAGATVAQGVSPDADAMAARVVQRLRTEPVAVSRRPFRWVAGLAAAAVLVVVFTQGGGRVLLPRGAAAPLSTGPSAPPLVVDLPGLDALDPSDLERVLDAVDAPWTETSTVDSPSLDDLNDQELARVARAWES